MPNYRLGEDGLYSTMFGGRGCTHLLSLDGLVKSFKLVWVHCYMEDEVSKKETKTSKTRCKKFFTYS